jgi:hypothetical protein
MALLKREKEMHRTVQSIDFTWHTPALLLDFSFHFGPVKLVDLRPTRSDLVRAAERPAAQQPLVELAVPQFGQGGDESKLIDTPIGKRLVYLTHRAESSLGVERLTITQTDDQTGLEVDSVLEVVDGAPAVRSVTIVRLRDGEAPLRLLHVSSLATAAVISDDLANLDIWSASSSPRAEARWGRRPLRSPGLAVIDPNERGEYSWGGVQVLGFGTRSTLFNAPAGALVDRINRNDGCVAD